MGSLTTRVLVAAGLVLVLFLGLTVAALDITFRNAAERAIRDRLNIQVLALMTAAEMDEHGVLVLPDTLPEPRFSSPGSGLYAQVLDSGGRTVWRSPSSVGQVLPAPDSTQAGVRTFSRIHAADDTGLFLLGFSVLWDSDNADHEPQVFHFMVAESLQSYLAQLVRFRANLLGWFGLVFAGLIGAQLLILRRTLRPLRALAEEVADVEAGRLEAVEGSYPRELQRLARNLNTLIGSERGNLRRYRDSLADLAHSLKTPLAVLRNALQGYGPDREATIASQIERMDDIVRYQLQRAAAMGGPSFGIPVPVLPQVRLVVDSLSKVHRDTQVAFLVNVPAHAEFRGDAGDLLEILGNLMDNASKWARSRVDVGGSCGEDGGLTLWVDDDGDGIAPAKRDQVLSRGRRADERVEGYGLGLAIVAGIVDQSGGELSLSDSPLGGLRASVSFPGRNLR